MTTAALFLVAAAVGALARAEAGRRGNLPGAVPWGTVAVNVTGSLMLGMLWEVGPPAVTVLGAGGLGAYTTFSSFARDAVALAERGRLLASAAYVAVTCSAGLAAAALGVALVT